ncbi:protein Gawky isoform X3 [Atheta coriaria]|uniref:protein Gawky isoform X3 n=1 Tax=Dalotia coriaria TaxID=877792 RepID=UPI0031F37EA1
MASLLLPVDFVVRRIHQSKSAPANQDLWLARLTWSTSKMRAPVPSEPNYTFPTYQVPQVSAMRGSAPPVQVARASRAVGAEPPQVSHRVPDVNVPSVITGSSCPAGNSNLRMQSVTDNCLLNSVTVPKIQRNVAHNNSDKLACKSGALLLLGQDIPGNQKADKILPGLTTTQYLDHDDDTTATTPRGGYYSYDRLVALSMWTRSLERSAVPLPVMRLLGGGESSINTGTSGWGTPPSQQASNNNANTSSGWGTANPANQNNAGTQQWNNNSNRPPNSGPGNTNQDANKANSNLPTNGQPPNGSQGGSGWGPTPKAQQQPPPQQAGQAGGGVVGVVVNSPATSNANTTNQSNATQGQTSGNSTKQQLEQLSNMREAIFSQDGWGGQYVNQDTNWDIPDYPEPAIKLDGGAASSGPPWKPPVNNGTDLWEANLRNGGQPPPQPQQKTPWGHTPSTNIGGTWGEDDDVSDSSSVWTGGPAGPPQQWGGNVGANNASGSSAPHLWGGAKKENDWNTPTSGGSGGWGDPRAPDPRAPPMDHRDIRPDPREMRAGSNDQMRLVDPQLRLPVGDMRGDLRGITGRLNGSGAETFWPQGGPQAPAHHMHHQGKMPVGPGGNGGAGWEEPSPPSQRRNMPNYDDGTSLWGNPQQGSHWKDLPTGGGGAGAMQRGAVNVNGPPGMAPNARPGMKPPMSGDGGSVWRNGTSWGEEQGPAGGWEEGGPWSKPKAMGGGGGALWAENDMDWSQKQGNKQHISKEAIWASKQFRVLIDLGFKKDEVENALRSRDMSMEEAVEMLNSSRMEWSRRHDDHYDHQQFAGRGGFQAGPSGIFPPGSGTPNLINNMGGSSGTNNPFNNMSPAVVQKMLSGGSQGFGACSTGSGGRSAVPMPSNPSTAQLRMLVQQIQMAVQAGYLNHQILNQPLAPQTLVLLNQLLQQIKQLQNFSNQQSLAQNQCIGSSKLPNMVQNLAVFITKTKQQITNLQNQIASQQANYVKQQQQPMRGDSDMFKSNPLSDAITLQTNFNDLSIKDTQTQQQSRLTQWKLPNIDKEESSDFSLAPGSTRKPLVPSHSSPNLNPLGLSQANGPWSTVGRGRGDSGWPDSTPGENSDLKDAQWPTDLVPEFEPGKPWKGNQKSIEDDPSITPGSVVRSPLLPVLKDEPFNIPSKSPPADDNAIQPSTFSLSSSTWSYSSSLSNVFTSSPQNKVPTTKGVLSDLTPTTAANTGLWGAPKAGPPPPPGLPTKGGNPAVNGWSSNIGTSGASWGPSPRSSNWSNSEWLLLRNLTAQIDGSTLRTLCMQHGPLSTFQLHLHQGFALAKYQTNEEAAKAQSALNSCVLGNTTIVAENPTDWEATSLLHPVVSNQGGSGGGWRGAGKQPPPQSQQQQQPPPQQSHTDMWGTGWSNTQSGSLWPSTPLDSAEQSRGTPSNLQSYLPGDLLGGESI